MTDKVMSDVKKKMTLAISAKSSAVSLLLCVFFGPVGLLYATPWGGVFMIAVSLIFVRPAYPVVILLVWLVCCVWSAFAMCRYNKKLLACFSSECCKGKEE